MSIADYGFAIWETFYVTVLSTAFALVLGLPLGVLLVAGDKDGILPLPGWLMHLLNIIINILRSVPFLILMICVFPLTRLIVGTTVGTKATIVPLVASLAAEKGILVSVLSADTRDLSGQCYGSMLLKLPAELAVAQQAVEYMRSQSGVTVEEVTGI